MSINTYRPDQEILIPQGVGAQANVMRGYRGGEGVRTPTPEKSQNIGFLSNIGLDPQKNTKLPNKHSMLGHHRHASETPITGILAFRWRTNNGPLMVVFGSYLPSSTKNKNVVKVGPLPTKLSGSVHECRDSPEPSLLAYVTYGCR